MHLDSLADALLDRLELQYPHTGRTSCISSASTVARNSWIIAVPSHGSNFMHHEEIVRRTHYTQDCSTLTRVELHASTWRSRSCMRMNNCSTLTRVELHASDKRRRKRAGDAIAVPSHGSNFMHLAHRAHLQFLDRRIAVPSHGSNFMHPRAVGERIVG